MVEIVTWGQLIFDTFTDLGGSFLFAPSGIPGFENWSLAMICLGGGLLGILTFKAVKFVTDIVL